MRFSVLDLSPIPSGSSAAQALRNTIDLARHAEAIGLHRYWLAEHHNAGSLASSSPEILIGAVAAATSRIRVGSGGVMLPNHSPLKIAETFRVLVALHGDRIDLGVGRAAGTDPVQVLRQMLHEYVSFALFSAGAALGSSAEAELVRRVRPMLAVLKPQA